MTVKGNKVDFEKWEIAMERKIGEIFEYNGEWYQCVEENGCEVCIFNNKKCYTFISDDDPIGYCEADRRKDNKDVIFKKLEKVGEPFTLTIHVEERLVPMQEYKLYDVNFCKENDLLMYVSDYKHKRIAIEIKQNKEDMEEKKVMIGKLACKYIKGKITYEAFRKVVKELCDNDEESKPTLKEFNLEAAKAGKPVCTRDGRKARIICFDAKGDFPIVALVETNNIEEVYQYTNNGLFFHLESNDLERVDDLMMLTEKRIGWININKDAGLFKSKEEAERDCTKDYATVRVEFEI